MDKCSRSSDSLGCCSISLINCQSYSSGNSGNWQVSTPQNLLSLSLIYKTSEPTAFIQLCFCFGQQTTVATRCLSANWTHWGSAIFPLHWHLQVSLCSGHMCSDICGCVILVGSLIDIFLSIDTCPQTDTLMLDTRHSVGWVRSQFTAFFMWDLRTRLQFWFLLFWYSFIYIYIYIYICGRLFQSLTAKALAPLVFNLHLGMASNARPEDLRLCPDSEGDKSSEI